jgi:hypothetical protein
MLNLLWIVFVGITKMPMTPDEVEAIKVIWEIREGYHKYGKTYKALTSALTLLQDYQKLRENCVDKAE